MDMMSYVINVFTGSIVRTAALMFAFDTTRDWFKGVVKGWYVLFWMLR